MNQDIKNICCIGAGYVGGPTMSVIASNCPNIQVNVVDINPERVAAWNDRDIANLPIYEPGLGQIIKKCRGYNLHFSTNIEENISKADLIFISVNTPTKTSGIGAGQAIDLKWVEESSRTIAKYAKGFTIVVEKSTLPVKTAQKIKEILQATSANKGVSFEKKFSVLSNPEFLAEGNAIKNLEEPDRILIGGDDEESIKALAGIYSKWVDVKKILTTDLWSSELSKLIANAFLAQRISSINSMSALCEITGAHIKDVAVAVGADKRIGKYFLNAGPGFGGSCFKKDISNLIYICNHYGLYEVSEYWQKVLDINNWQQRRLIEIILKKLFGTISEKKIAILGFSFKADTNDTRESPAIFICKKLIEEGANLYIYDPKVNNNQIDYDLKRVLEKSFHEKDLWQCCELIEEATNNADAAVILTEWDEFKKLNWNAINKMMRQPAWIFDTRSTIEIKKLANKNINIWQTGFGN
tara:strand:- start:3433 stop:4839 length:1407 start_codon:yes stop_codon:yes gene_type:complete